MSNVPPNDPELQSFLNQHSKPTASSDELAKLAEHTRRNPPKRGNGLAMAGGGGLIVLLVVIRIIGVAMRAGTRDHYEDRPSYSPAYNSPPAAQSQLSTEEMSALQSTLESIQRRRAQPQEDAPDEPATVPLAP